MYEFKESLVRSIISITILYLLARLMGKKQISQLTFFDYVCGISIGSIAANFAVDSSISYINSITSMIIYALFPIILSYVTLKSYFFRKLLDGKPTLLIQNGKILEKGLKKTKLTINDLLEECRLKNAFNLLEIESAILETSGKLSIQKKAIYEPLTPKDMNLQVPYKGICINLIIDGKILDDHLKIVNKDINWINMELKNKGVKNINDILLAYLDGSGVLNLQFKVFNIPYIPLI